MSRRGLYTQNYPDSQPGFTDYPDSQTTPVAVPSNSFPTLHSAVLDNSTVVDTGHARILAGILAFAVYTLVGFIAPSFHRIPI